MLARNSIQLHVAAGIENTEETAVHRLNQLIGPRNRSHAPSRVAIQGETRLLKNVYPFHLLLPLARGDPSESKRDEAVHRHFQPLIKLAVNAVNA